MSGAGKRKKYDELGADWERGASQEEMMRRYARQQSAAGAGARGGADFSGGGADFGDFSDFFGQFFGGGGRRGSTRSRTGAWRGFGGFNFGTEPPRAPDLRAEVKISIVDAMRGARQRLQLPPEDQCATSRATRMAPPH